MQCNRILFLFFSIVLQNSKKMTGLSFSSGFTSFFLLKKKKTTMMKGRGLVWLVDEKKRMEFKKTREWISSLAVCDTTVGFLRFEKFILTFMSTDPTSYTDGICMVSFLMNRVLIHCTFLTNIPLWKIIYSCENLFMFKITFMCFQVFYLSLVRYLFQISLCFAIDACAKYCENQSYQGF